MEIALIYARAANGHRAEVYLFVLRIPHLQFLHFNQESFQKAIVNLVFNQDP